MMLEPNKNNQININLKNTIIIHKNSINLFYKNIVVEIFRKRLYNMYKASIVLMQDYYIRRRGISMKKLKLSLSILISFILFTVFTFGDCQLIPAANVEAAMKAPVVSVKNETLYSGGDSYTIKIKNLASKAKVTYKSSDSNIAKVSVKGVVKPVKEGTAKITVTVKQNNKTYTCKIKITVKTSEAKAAPVVTAAPTAAPTPVPDASSNAGEIPSLAKTYSNYFKIGTCINGFTYKIPFLTKLLSSQFNAITMENEMKPDSILDHDKSVSDLNKYNLSPAINTNNIDQYLKFAQSNGLKVRYHVLVWHSQTPRWFFAVNYSDQPNAPLVSRDVMLSRMENYIRQVMQAASKYPGVIYAWDVVNEAIDVNDHQANGLRTTNSLWYKVVGEDFIEKAFEYARKYSYDKAPLFYNDYSTYDKDKRVAIVNLLQKLKDKGLVDGIGMQTHIDMDNPSVSDYEETIKTFAKLNLEINVTEMDMHNNKNTPEALKAQADRYGDLFKVLVKLKKDGTANITAVTFWGISDAFTWLTGFRRETSYPLLFDKNGLPKPAFYSVIDAAKQ